MSHALTINRLSVAYGRAAPAVADVSFELASGGTLGLIGESGSGKSTVVNAILGMLSHNAHPTGQITYGADDLLGLDQKALRRLRGRRIAVVPQAALGALNPMLRIGDQMTELVRLYGGLGRGAGWRRATELLDAVGLPEPGKGMAAYPHQLSGGQCQRVLIAMALAGDPTLVLADEPTTALDVTVQQRILDLIRSLQRDLGFSLIFVTHHLALLPGLADQLVVMRQGRVVETGQTAEVIAGPRADYTRTLLSIAKEAENPGRATVERTIPKSSSRAAMVVRDLTVTYSSATMWRRRRRTALANVSFTLQPGTCLGIVGESGSGKSTLLRALMGLVPSTGSVTIDDTAVNTGTTNARRALRRNVHLVFQDSAGVLNPALTIREILREPLQAQGLPVREGDLARVLEDVNLPTAYLARHPTDLSGGQRQRVAIARGLVLRPRLLLLDEPLSALDVSTQRELIALLLRVQREHGLTYIIVSHDLDVMRTLADQIMVLYRGEVVEQGTTPDIFARPEQDYTRTLVAAVPKLYGPSTRGGTLGTGETLR
jgi:ABC-type glutathione transport system ATPase component